MMSSTGSPAQPLTLPDARIAVLDGEGLGRAFRRWAQGVTNTVNAIPDTSKIAMIEAQIAALETDVEEAQATAATALATANQALSQADNTLGYVALARLDGSRA